MSSTVEICNFIGFETGDIVEAAATPTAGVGISSTTVRTGTYALQIDGDGVNPQNYKIMKHSTVDGSHNTNLNCATTYVCVYFRIGSAPTLTPESIVVIRNVDALPKIKGEIRLTTDRKVNFYDNSGGTLRQSGTTVLALDRWYRIELKVGTETGIDNAPYELRIDGTTEYSGSDGNTGSTNAGDVHLGCLSVHNAATWQFFYDDVSINHSDFIGDSKVTMAAVSGNGSFTGWTGDYTAVDDTPLDTADFVYSSSIGTSESVASTAIGTYGINLTSTIHAVKANFDCRRFGAGTTGVRYFAYLNTTIDQTSGDDALGTSWVFRAVLHNTDFSTGLDWDSTGADAYEPGVTQNKTAIARCCYMRKYILWTPGVSNVAARYTPHAGI